MKFWKPPAVDPATTARGNLHGWKTCSLQFSSHSPVLSRTRKTRRAPPQRRPAAQQYRIWMKAEPLNFLQNSNLAHVLKILKSQPAPVPNKSPRKRPGKELKNVEDHAADKSAWRPMSGGHLFFLISRTLECWKVCVSSRKRFVFMTLVPWCFTKQIKLQEYPETLGHGLPGAKSCTTFTSLGKKFTSNTYMGVVQNTFSRTALNRSANRVATAVPQWAIAEGFVLRWSDHIHKI